MLKGEGFNARGYVVNCQYAAGHCAAELDLCTAAWEFMKAHPYGIDPEPYTTSGLPDV